jgi:hypothetical protein
MSGDMSLTRNKRRSVSRRKGVMHGSVGVVVLFCIASDIAESSEVFLGLGLVASNVRSDE